MLSPFAEKLLTCLIVAAIVTLILTSAHLAAELATSGCH